MSRTEEYYRYLATGKGAIPKPLTREEQYLYALCTELNPEALAFAKEYSEIMEGYLEDAQGVLEDIQEVQESIPQDYSALSSDVTELETDLQSFSLQMLKNDNWIEGSLYNRGSTGIWNNMPNYKRYPALSLKSGIEYTIINAADTFCSIKYSNNTVVELKNLNTYSTTNHISTFTLSEDADIYISALISDVVMLIVGSIPTDYIEGYYDVQTAENTANINNLLNKQDLFYNLAHGTVITEGKYIIASNGNLGTLAQFKCTDYIAIPEVSSLYIKRTFHYGGDGLAFYNKDKVYISGDATVGTDFATITVPETAKYIRTSAYLTETIEIYLGSIAEAIEDIANETYNKAIDFNVLEKEVQNTLLADINSVQKNSGDVTISNGTIIHERSTSGNSWWFLPVSGYDTSKNMVIFTFNLTELNEGNVGRAYLFGKGSDDSNKYRPLGDVDETGTYSYLVDLNYHVVYGDVDLSKGISFGVANQQPNDGSGTYHAEYDFVAVYDYTTYLDTAKNLGENLNDMIQRIESVENDTEAVKAIASDKRVSPNGTKYIIQVADDGTLKTVPQIPSNVLYIGNSLLLGFSTFGMAATRSSEDYYYYVNDYLSGLINNLTTDRQQGSGYESCTSTAEQDTWLSGTLLPKLNNDLQLVIIQLGDNVNTAEKLAVFENGAKKLITYIRQNAPNARVAWVGEWYSSATKQTYISNACVECGAQFIDISDLSSITGNQNAVGNIYYDDNGGEHEITSSGVASHPSSQGMRQIADRIIEGLFA